MQIPSHSVRLSPSSANITKVSQPSHSMQFGSSSDAYVPTSSTTGQKLTGKARKEALRLEKERKAADRKKQRETGVAGVRQALTSNPVPEPTVPETQPGINILFRDDKLESESQALINARKQRARNEIGDKDLQYHQDRFDDVLAGRTKSVTVPKTMTIAGEEMSFSDATNKFQEALKMLAQGANQAAIEEGKRKEEPTENVNK